VAADLDVALAVGQRFARGDEQLRFDDIDAVTSSVTGCSTCTRVFISMK